MVWIRQRVELTPRAKCPLQQQPRDRLRRAAGCAHLRGDALKARRRGGPVQASVSAQMLRAHASAYLPSSSLAAAETPPESGTVSMVFLAAS